MVQITGLTRIFGIVADPIAHVKTPQMINARLARNGVDGVLVPLHVGETDLATAFAAFRGMRNLEGWIVTVPHKTAALALCDEVSPHARAIGAVNCVRRRADGSLLGTMLDGAGFIDGLRWEGIEPSGRSVHLAGAGGAASAIAFALCAAGVKRLAIGNRSAAKRDALVARLREHHPGTEVIAGGNAAGADIVVNATSLGLRPGDPSPVDAAELSPGQIVAEIIMEPELTPLLHAAKAKGCRIHLGRHMLEAQADAMVRHMTGETSQ